MMIRRSAERGVADHGWLLSHHTFSFARYYDSRYMGFRALRVINEDTVQPGSGFGAHSHQDMEIISYVLDGELAHQDNLGNGAVIRPGDVQRMSAGTGVTHSEFNASDKEAVHFLQIWILPSEQGLPPSYEQKSFTEEERRGRLRLIASNDGREGSVLVHQDVSLYAGLLDAGQEITHAVDVDRYVWLQVARGQVEMGGHVLEAGDAVAMGGSPSLRLRGGMASEVLLFDLA